MDINKRLHSVAPNFGFALTFTFTFTYGIASHSTVALIASHKLRIACIRKEAAA